MRRPSLFLSAAALAAQVTLAVALEPAQAPSMSSVLADSKAGRVESVEVSSDTGFVTMKDGSKVEIGLTLHWRSWLEEVASTGVPVRATADPVKAIFLWNAWLSIGMSVLMLVILGLLAVRFARGTMASPMRRIGENARLRRLLGLKPEPVYTFADVAGAEEAKASLQEMVAMLRDPSRFSDVGGRWPSGVLLVGDPGNGKTLLAKAVAGEAGVPFHATSGSEFVMMFAGLGAHKVRAAFKAARRKTPCILFIDEIDTLGGKRPPGSAYGADKEHEQTLTQLLKEMDGMGTEPGVIVIGATNRPEALDPALLRTGRFDRHIVVEQPGAAAREEILKIHSRRLRLAADVDFAVLARATVNFSGSDLEALANEAALEAGSQGAPAVTHEHFERARDRKLLGGAERKGFVMSREELELIAVHEAGHALAACLQEKSDPVHKATITARGRALGFVAQLPQADRRIVRRSKLEADLVVALAGRAAEEVVFGPGEVSSGAAADIGQATAIARGMVSRFGMDGSLVDLTDRSQLSQETLREMDDSVKRIVSEAYVRALALVRGAKPALDGISAALLERETLTGDEVRAICSRPQAEPRASSI